MKVATTLATGLAAWTVAVQAFVIPDPQTTAFGAQLQQQAERLSLQAQDKAAAAIDELADRARPIVHRWTGAWEEGKKALGHEVKTLAREHDETVLDFVLKSKYFTKLAKVIKEDDELKDLLKAESKYGLTLFAPPDRSIPDHHHDDEKNILSAFGIDVLAEEHRGPPKELLRAVVKYHIVPSYAYSFEALRSGYNVTLATALTSDKGYLNGEPQRLSLGLVGVGVKVNVFSDVLLKYADQKCTNGIVQPISRPLLPPPNMMQILWFAPQLFSTLTTAIQKVNLTDIFQTTAKEFTAFGPINTAWDALPPKAIAFLFSPFGKKYLKGLLAYHTSPLHYISPDYYHVGEAEKSEAELNDRDSSLVEVLDRVLDRFRVPCSVHRHLGARKAHQQHHDADVDMTDASETVHHHYRVPSALTMLLDKDNSESQDDALTAEDFARTMEQIMASEDEDSHSASRGHEHKGELDTYLYVDTYRTIIQPKLALLPRVVPAGSIKVNGQTVAVSDVVARNGVAHAIGKVLIPKRYEKE